MKITRRFYSLSTAIITLGLVTTSCGLSDELDTINSIDSIEATGNFNANLVDVTWQLKDIIPSDELNFKEQEDGTYSLSFDSKGDFTPETTTFPSVDFNSPNIPLSLLNLDSNYNSAAAGTYFDLPPNVITIDVPKPSIEGTNFSPDFKISYVKLKAGAKIDLKVTNTSNAVANLTVAIPSLTIKVNNIDKPYIKTFPAVQAGQTVNLTMDDLAGYVLDTDPQINLAIKASVKKPITPITGQISASFSLDIGNHNEYVQGFFGEMTLQSDPVEAPISISDLIKGNDGEMTIKEAYITVAVAKTGLKAPVDLDFSSGNVCYYKDNNNPKPLSVTKVNTSDPDTFKFKVSNLNILNLEKIVLNPKAILNKGLTSNDNVSNEVYDNASISYSVKAEVPLDIKADGIVFEQAGDNPFSDIELDSEDYEIKDGRVLVKGKITSELPLGAILQVRYSETEDGPLVATLFDEPIILNNANTNNGKTTFQLVVTKERLDKIKQYPYQVIQLTVNGDGAIKSSQKINFKVGVAVKGTIKGDL